MSDGPSDMARLERSDPGAMGDAGARLDAATANLRATVARSEAVLGAARLLLMLAGPVAATVPGGAIGVEVAKVALEMAAGRKAAGGTGA